MDANLNDHRLGISSALGAAQRAELARREAQSPAGDGEAGVVLGPGADLSALGMSGAAVVPAGGAPERAYPPLRVTIERGGA